MMIDTPDASQGSTIHTLRETHQRLACDFLAGIGPVPEFEAERGVVICAGGEKYIPCAWVCVNMLRHLGCALPVEIWHRGSQEMPIASRTAFEGLGVDFVDAFEVRERHPARILNGWELKAYAILHSKFRQVLLLDADNVPVKDPTFLFESAEFREHGAILWPDQEFGPKLEAWHACGVAYRYEVEVESGQVMIDKAMSWEAINFIKHLNDHSDFYYRFFYGDKETFHLGFRRVEKSYAMPSRFWRGLVTRNGELSTMVQHDFEGAELFYHRNFTKWRREFGANVSIPGFRNEDVCLEYLKKFDEFMGERIGQGRGFDETETDESARARAERLMSLKWVYCRVGLDSRLMAFDKSGRVGLGGAECERFWRLAARNGDWVLSLESDLGTTCELVEDSEGVWRGTWLIAEKCLVLLVRAASPPV